MHPFPKGEGVPARALLTAALVALAAVPVAAATLGVRPDYVAGPYPTGPFTFVNQAVGAGIFYNSGFLGGSAVIGNVEAGYIWDEQEVFDRSGLGLGPAVELYVAGTDVDGEYDFHATMVGHVLAGTGYVAATGSTAAGYSYVGTGLAPLARLWSGAIATAYATSTNAIGVFDSTPASTIPVYRQFFQGIAGTACDVINSSFGYEDPAALAPESLAVDALAFQNPTVTFVASAGNSDTAPVGAPGACYNGITVGSVGGTNFRTPSAFSSRGPVDFYDPASDTLFEGVRAAVDIAAPGENGFLAAYLGSTGGLAPLTSITQDPSPTDLYFTNVDGTSFASPTVAGGIALMTDAAKGLLGMPATALDARVVKAVLMASAARTEGWNNGQVVAGGVTRTTQALDWATGAGALDLTAAGRLYVESTTLDVTNPTGAVIGSNGWDLGTVAVGGHTDYAFSVAFGAATELQVALDWFADGTFDGLTDTAARTAFANLDLQVWCIVGGSFAALVAESTSLYNNEEFLRFTLPGPGQYGLRVSLPGMIYNVGLSPIVDQTFGLAWNSIIVPEPAAGFVAALGLAVAAVVFRRRRPAPDG